LVAKASALVQSAPGDADALLALAEAALAAHDAVAANKAITQRIALLPDDANSYYLQGRARRMALDAAGAETSLRKALTLAPGQADALSALAALLLDTGKYAEADAVYETLASRGPTMLEGRLGRIDALLGLRRFDDAQVQLDAVPEAQRNLAAYRMSAASLALARDKPADALTLLRPLVDAPTKKPLVLVLYGDALHAAEQVNAAAGAYEAALAIDPELPEALIGRAEIHLHAERPQDALSILETAQKSLPTRLRPPALRARLLSALGHSYIMRSRRGDDDAARAALREAVQLSGAAPDTFFWLGESLGGKITPEAQAAYQRYLALEPNGKYADRARRALGPLLSAAPPTPLPSTHRSTP
jgi:tetratricopeptide (TPR) repeat protein